MGDHGKLFNYFELISKMQMCTMSQHVRVTLIPHSLCWCGERKEDFKGYKAGSGGQVCREMQNKWQTWWKKLLEDYAVESKYQSLSPSSDTFGLKGGQADSGAEPLILLWSKEGLTSRSGWCLGLLGPFVFRYSVWFTGIEMGWWAVPDPGE